MRNVQMYLPSKYEHKNTYGYWVRKTPVFSQSEAYGLVNQKPMVIGMVTLATRWKYYTDFESLWQGLQCGIWYILAFKKVV